MGGTSLDAVVVTGAGRGIGRAVALHLGGQGVPTLCISRTDNAARTRDGITALGGTAHALSLDLADHVAVEAAVGTWVEASPYRRMGVVLAAAVLGPTGALETTDLAGWAGAFAVNVVGNLAVVRALLPRLVDAGWGRVAFLAGGGAAYAYPIFPAYACTKAAVVRAAENLHEDLRQRGDFAVACLAPGAVETDMLASVRAAGAEVRTTAPVENTLRFVDSFLAEGTGALSGRFVHALDEWRKVLDGSTTLGEEQWKLRRVE